MIYAALARIAAFAVQAPDGALPLRIVEGHARFLWPIDAGRAYLVATPVRASTRSADVMVRAASPERLLATSLFHLTLPG
jgi:hypothetical protein